MLREAKTLERHELRAHDGIIGHVSDFLFDDEKWQVRYLVAETGNWLASRPVLISPVALRAPEWHRKVLPVDLTKEQVRNSPALEDAARVSREQENRLTQYYNWPAYWGAAGFPETGVVSPIVPVAVEPAAGGDADQRRYPRQTSHPYTDSRANPPAQLEHRVHSMRATTGNTIEATDGAIGHVDDFLVDDRSWQVRYVVVDTRNWWPGKQVLIAPQWITDVNWEAGKVYVDLTRATIKGGPTYDPTQPVTPDYSGQLHDYYGRPRYRGC
jgi:hypothetical protein